MITYAYQNCIDSTQTIAYDKTNKVLEHKTEKFNTFLFEQRHEIPNNAVCATSKASDQPAHTRNLIRAFASRLNIL